MAEEKLGRILEILGVGVDHAKGDAKEVLKDANAGEKLKKGGEKVEGEL